MSRSRKYSDEQLEEVHRLVLGGLGVSKACEKEGVSRQAYARWKKEREEPAPGQVLELHQGGKKKRPNDQAPAPSETPSQMLDRKLMDAFVSRAQAEADGDEHGVYYADLQLVFFGSLRNASFNSAFQARTKMAELKRVDKPPEVQGDPFKDLTMEQVELIKGGDFDQLPEDLQEQLLAAAGT